MYMFIWTCVSLSPFFILLPPFCTPPFFLSSFSIIPIETKDLQEPRNAEFSSVLGAVHK